MTVDEFVSSDVWLIECLDGIDVESRRRGIAVHHELDPELHLRRTAALTAAFDDLFRFVFSTVPDGCEVFVASLRSASSVSALGCGQLTLRWQIAGSDRRPAIGNVTSIRPLAGAASTHLESEAAQALERSFSAAGWRLALSGLNEDRELWARVDTR